MDPLEFRGFEKVLWVSRPALWLMSSIVSAMLVNWLYIDPIYGLPWSSILGAMLFGLLSVYSAAYCLLSLRSLRRLGLGPPANRVARPRKPITAPPDASDQGVMSLLVAQ
jgi:hypothetical protein